MPEIQSRDSKESMSAMSIDHGRHFLQVPGPTNVPERVMRAIAAPTIDHRSPAFKQFAGSLLERLPRAFRSDGPVVVFAGSGTGAWEASLVNTCSPGDRVLMFETGHFSMLWHDLARRFGLDVDYVTGNWRSGVDAEILADKLAADSDRQIKAVAVVHNETSTGVTSDIGAIRSALDNADHPALLLVDVISSLGSIDVRCADWGIDVAVGGSQKGLMLPPGLGLNAISKKAHTAAKTATLPRAFWDWQGILDANGGGLFPFTPAINMLFGLKEALDMFDEMGWDAVLARHVRHGAAAREAVAAWGLELQPANPTEYSDALTVVRMPEGHSGDALRGVILDAYEMSLGAGLSKLADRVFRIGHMGAFNDLMLAGSLAGVEMGLARTGVPFRKGGVQAALDLLAEPPAERTRAAAE